MTRLRLLVPTALAGLLLAGCGSGEDVGSPGTAASGTFPATATHKFGTTVVKQAPKRIAIVGLTEQDTVLALGEKPIATTEWYGDQPSATWPWARKALGTAKPTVLHTDDGFEYEKLAQLRPDLIIGTNSGMTRRDYEKMTRIAPTVAGPVGGTRYFSPWDQQTRLIADALGKPAEGRRLVTSIRARYAKAAADHPQLRGKTVSFSQNGFSSGQLYAYPAGLNTQFLTYLGMRINPKLTPLATKRGEQVGVSTERLDVLDADAMVFATEKPKDITAFEKIPTFRRLDAVAGHRAVFTDATLSGAMYFISPLSLDYVLDRLTPQLVRAVAGKQPRKMLGGAT